MNFNFESFLAGAAAAVLLSFAHGQAKRMLERLRSQPPALTFAHVVLEGGGFWELYRGMLPRRVPVASPAFRPDAEATGYRLPPGWAPGRYFTWDPDGRMLEVTDRIVVDEERGLGCCPEELREKYEELAKLVKRGVS